MLPVGVWYFVIVVTLIGLLLRGRAAAVSLLVGVGACISFSFFLSFFLWQWVELTGRSRTTGSKKYYMCVCVCMNE